MTRDELLTMANGDHETMEHYIDLILEAVKPAFVESVIKLNERAETRQ